MIAKRLLTNRGGAFAAVAEDEFCCSVSVGFAGVSFGYLYVKRKDALTVSHNVRKCNFVRHIVNGGLTDLVRRFQSIRLHRFGAEDKEDDMRRFGVLLFVALVATPLFATGEPEDGEATARNAGGPLTKYDPPLVVSTWRRDDNRANFEGETITDNIWTRSIADQLGIEFEYDWIAPSAEFNAKVNTTLAAGDLPDLMNKLNLEQYSNLARVDRLAPQSQLIEGFDVGRVGFYLDFGPGITRKMLTVDGEIYGWGGGPNFSAAPLFTARGDWLDNLGLAMPETIDEIVNVLYAFSNDDPDGNGIDDTYGLATSAGFLRGGSPLTPFFALFDSYPELWVEGDDGLVYGALTPETLEALTLLRTFHQDEVLSPEWPVLSTWTDAPDEIAQDKVGASFGNFWWHNWGPVTQTVAANPGMEWQHVYPRRADGEFMLMPVNAQVSDISAMNSSFSNPEILVKLFNLHYQLLDNPETANSDYDTRVTDEGNLPSFFYWNDFLGEIRVDRLPASARRIAEAVETGDPSGLDPVTLVSYESILAYLDGTADLSGGDSPYGVYRTAGPGGVNSELVWTVINGNYYQVDAFQDTPTPAQTSFAGDLRSTRDELFIQMIVGALELDEGWTRWQQYWEQNGGAEWTAEVNDWYANQ